MTTTIKKTMGFMAVMTVLVSGFLTNAMSVQAATPLTEEDLFGGEKQAIADALGGNADPKTPQEIAAAVIRILLGFLGIIAVVIILVAGFQWMTAGGDAAKVDGAKKRLTAAVIGLIIILSAWGISSFLMDKLLGATQGASVQ